MACVNLRGRRDGTAGDEIDALRSFVDRVFR